MSKTPKQTKNKKLASSSIPYGSGPKPKPNRTKNPKLKQLSFEVAGKIGSLSHVNCDLRLSSVI